MIGVKSLSRKAFKEIAKHTSNSAFENENVEVNAKNVSRKEGSYNRKRGNQRC